MSEVKEQSKCELCGELMPIGEEAFRYHGFSGDCPKMSESLKPFVGNMTRVTISKNLKDREAITWPSQEEIDRTAFKTFGETTSAHVFIIGVNWLKEWMTRGDGNE